MKFEYTEVFNFSGAIRGMRNAWKSWALSDSHYEYDPENMGKTYYKIGRRDMELMQKLIKAGPEHRKFMRQIFVSVDITAPLFFWPEFDQYKIGVTTNSESKMHTITKAPITAECFENNELINEFFIEHLENLRTGCQEAEEAEEKNALWKALIVCLPESFLQKRTVTMNYENVRNIYHQRKNHKLTEWREDFKAWAECLPYFNELIKE